MFDYSFLGAEVRVPDGFGRYLGHKNGKVLVVMDHETPPVEFDASQVYLMGR